jgi:hypothetical protein
MKIKHLVLISACIFSLSAGAQVSISPNNAAPDNSAMLDVSSSAKGVLFPRMTVDQRNAIVNPADGLMIYCTNCGTNGTGVLNIRSNGSWNGIAPCMTDTPVALAHLSSGTSIIWKWGISANQAGFKINTVNNYATASDLGNATSYLEQNLTCNTAYTRYLWAYSSCNVSQPVTLSWNTLSCSLVNLLTENFESTPIGQTPPAGWITTLVNGENFINFAADGFFPSCVPYSGSRMLEFKSYDAPEGVENRFRTTMPINVIGRYGISVDFAWMNDAGFSGSADYVNVQWSYDGINWQTAAKIYRNGPLEGWRVISVPLVLYPTQYTFYVGFDFMSEFGNNCHLDLIHVTGN